MLTEFIESNFKKVICKQLRIVNDPLLTKAIADNSLDIGLLKTWMNGYGLYRGIKDGMREDVCKLYMTFINSTLLN